jgi:hypothetical protein
MHLVLERLAIKKKITDTTLPSSDSFERQSAALQSPHQYAASGLEVLNSTTRTSTLPDLHHSLNLQNRHCR